MIKFVGKLNAYYTLTIKITINNNLPKFQHRCRAEHDNVTSVIVLAF